MHMAWRTVVEGVIGSMAYVVDGRWNLVACNAEFRGAPRPPRLWRIPDTDVTPPPRPPVTLGA